MKRSKHTSATIWLVAILFILTWVWFQADRWYAGRLKIKQVKTASDLLIPHANALTAAVSRRLSLVDALEAFVKIHPEEESLRREFDAFAKGLYSSGSGIRAIQIYPGGISKYIYPLEGNQGLIGRNLLKDERPEIQADVKRALEFDRITLSGPFMLRQGGLGLVARRAIRLHGRFWGFANIVMDIPPILEEAGLNNKGQSNIALILEDPEGKVFYGRPGRRIASATLTLPEGKWRISAVPNSRWRAAFSREQTNFRIMFSCLMGLLFVITYLVVTRQERLVQAVGERTRDLLTANEALEKDIRERSAVEKSLVESEERYRALVEQASDGIFLADAMGRYIEVNRMACQMLGYSREELQSIGITDLLHPEEAVRGVQGFSELGDGENHRFEFRLRKADGVFILTDISARKIGENRFLGIVRDITEQKKNEDALRQLTEELEKRVLERTSELEAANKELESFSFSVSHDLRAPLRGISGFSQVLLEDYADQLDETGRDYLQRVHQAGIRMGGLIDDLLKLSRLNQSELNPVEVDLSRLVESIAAELGETQPDRAVEWRIAPGVKARGDERLIRIALENLLGNAWKFTGKTGSPRIEFGLLEREGETVYFIRDNGAGFDMEFAGKLFTPFQRLHSPGEFEGNGIGLATVQRIVRRHGGRIWVESAVWQGATFFFTLKL